MKDEVVAAPPSSINVPIGTGRRLAVISTPLARLKEIKRALGGTVNDVVLAATAGGLRALLDSRGDTPPPQGLRAMVPVNIRRPASASPSAIALRRCSSTYRLPRQRPRGATRGRWRRPKASSRGPGHRVQHHDRPRGACSAGSPRSLRTRAVRDRLFNITVTNIPGPQEPLYAFGSRLLSVWPIVPLAASHAVGLAVFSYDGRMYFCLNADRDAMPDLEVLASGISASLDDLHELTPRRPRPWLPRTESRLFPDDAKRPAHMLSP